MQRVRAATDADVLRIVDMIEDLRAAVRGPIAVDRAWAAQTVARLISAPNGFVAVTSGGFIAGVVEPTIINPALIAKEMGWFSRDRSGFALLKAFENWARDGGATMVQLSTGPAGLDLTRLGYRAAELAWVR